MTIPLGCKSHSYTITDREGRVISSGGLLTEVEYNRVLNDSSSASVTIGVSDAECCNQLGGVRSWRHRLNIYRGVSLMWSGFVLNPRWDVESMTVQAVDLVGLLDRRVPHQDFNFTGTDLTAIAQLLIEDAFFPDDPGHEIVVIGPSGVTGGRAYPQNIGQTADHLRDLADTGIDFTAVGNTIVIMPDDFCEVVGRLTDTDLPDGLSVTEDGSNLVTRQIVAGSDESGVVGEAGGTNDYYGLLELYSEQTSITTTAAAQEAAVAKLASSAIVPVHIDTQSLTLSPDAAIDAASLVPGWCVDITTTATCRDVSQRLKITGLQVTESGGSDATPGQEQITLQVTATGDTLAVT
jgi:hypothetical protein